MLDHTAVFADFLKNNGVHPMTAEDEAYCREVFTELTDTEALSEKEALTRMRARQIPIPSYVLPGGTFMVYPDFYEVIAAAGGPEHLHDWFVGHWDAADQATAEEEWEGYRSGRYVCLRSVTPENIQAKTRLTTEIERLTGVLAADAENSGARGELAAAVDALDALEPAFTDYDRLRFGGPVSRDTAIDEVRRRYLSG